MQALVSGLLPVLCRFCNHRACGSQHTDSARRRRTGVQMLRYGTIAQRLFAAVTLAAMTAGMLVTIAEGLRV